MKKLLAIVLAAVMAFGVFAFTGCSDKTGKSDFKVGAILIGDENEGYTYAHIQGIEAAKKACNLSDDQIIYKYNVTEDEKCYEAAVDLAEQGCKLIIANSFGHEDHLIRAAKEYPDVVFCHATGKTAAKHTELNNIFNYFDSIYEARYVSGIVAGMKLKALMDEGKVTDPYIGYVGAYPYAEVVSGYTAFFLGIRSIVPEAHMDVQYTKEWFDLVKESEAANALMARGCVIMVSMRTPPAHPPLFRQSTKRAKPCSASATTLTCSALLPMLPSPLPRTIGVHITPMPLSRS